MDKKDKAMLRKFREKNFEAKLSHEPGLYEDSMTLSVTHNRTQWTSLMLLPNEIKAVANILNEYLKDRE